MALVGIFNWVIETSVMASILAVLILLVKYIFKDIIGAKWHYAIWGLLIIRLIMPISIESSLSIYNALHPGIIKIQKPLQSNFNSEALNTGNPVVKDSSDKNIVLADNNSAKLQSDNEAKLQPEITNNYYKSLISMLPIIWVVGALGLLIFIIFQSIVFYLRINREKVTGDRTIIDSLDECKENLGIKRTIPVAITNQIKTPCLFGILKPKILIPENLLYELSKENLKYILLHELSHYKRKDILVNWVAVCLQVMHWFNPIVWYSFRKMREDCELACDDYALSHLAENEHGKYGMTIINLLSISKSIWSPATTGFFGNNNKNQIIRRIKTIKMFKKPNLKWTVITVSIIICLGIIGLTNGLTQRENKTAGNISSNDVSSTPAYPADELLYGKYPEPLVIAVGKNMDVNKDYKTVTMEDLKKITNFYFESEMDQSYPDKSYGFEDGKEYDFSIVLEMPNLTALDVNLGENIKLEDYSILKKLTKLERLTVGNVNDDDIKNIVDLTSLKWFVICNSKDITSIEFLNSMKQLTFFGLDNVPNVHDYQPLKNLTNIEQVNLVNSGLTEKDVNSLPDMGSIKWLSLYNNKIISLNNFPEMKNLQSLLLSNNPLTEINILPSKMPNLKELLLDNTKISDLNKLSGVNSIESIALRNTGVKRISPLKEYKNLKEINIDPKNVEDLDVFKGSSVSIGVQE